MEVINILYLPGEIIYKIFSELSLTYNSLLELFYINKKINDLIKKKCAELNLGGLFLCTNKCEYDCRTINKEKEQVIKEQTGNNGRKYNSVYVTKHTMLIYIKHYLEGNNNWVCCKC